jgi:hypothetical protein
VMWIPCRCPRIVYRFQHRCDVFAFLKHSQS